MSPSASTDPERARRFWQAGLIYGALGLAIMALVLGDPQLLRPERRTDLVRLLIGLPIFALLAVSVAYGDRGLALILRAFGVEAVRAICIGRTSQRWLARVLAVAACARSVLFTFGALGYRLTVGGVEPMPTRSPVSMWLPVALVAAIAIMLIRAGWYRAPTELLSAEQPGTR